MKRQYEKSSKLMLSEEIGSIAILIINHYSRSAVGCAYLHVWFAFNLNKKPSALAISCSKIKRFPSVNI